MINTNDSTYLLSLFRCGIRLELCYNTLILRLVAHYLQYFVPKIFHLKKSFNCHFHMPRDPSKHFLAFDVTTLKFIFCLYKPY